MNVVVVVILGVVLVILFMVWRSHNSQPIPPLRKSSIAIIGNGPLSITCSDEIEDYGEVVYLNHCQHARTLGNVCEYLCLRQDGQAPKLASTQTPILEHLRGRISTQNIIIFGVSHASLLKSQVRNTFPRTGDIVFKHAWDPRYSPRLQNTTSKVNFADQVFTVPDTHPWGFTTGFLAICHFLEVYELVDLYGFTFEKPPREKIEGHPREFEKSIVNQARRCRIH